MRIALVIAATLWATQSSAQVQGVELDAPIPIPDFELTNSEGDVFTQDALPGSWTILMFGYNSCPDVCPFTLGNLEHAISETAMRVRPDNVPKVVFISVDPDRDDETVGEYAQYFHPDFLGVTGTREQIDLLIEATDSFYRLMEPDASDFYEVQHSSAVSVIGPDGALRAKLQPPFDAGLTAEFLARLQIKYRRETM